MLSAKTKFTELKMQPFGETPDLRFFFESETHLSALVALRAAISQGKGFSLLLGEVGVGKTMVTRALIHSIASDTDCALIIYPHQTESELIRTLCEELEIPDESDEIPSQKNDLRRLNQYLLENARKARRTLLVVDEAQNLAPSTLETIRLLSNLETGDRKLLHILLVAQPEFSATLARDELRQLRQRIGVTTFLRPLMREETGKYIRHRLERAGGGNLFRFEPTALALIQSASGGLPREINKICSLIVSRLSRNGPQRVTAGEVRATLPPGKKRSAGLMELFRLTFEKQLRDE